MNKSQRFAIAGSFFIGVFTNLLQITTLRLFLGFFYGTELHLGTFLAIWLTGIAIGGFFGGFVSPRPELLVWGLFLSPLWVIIGFPLGCSILPFQTGGFLPFLPLLLFQACILLPPTIMAGATIPAFLADKRERIEGLFTAESLGSFFAGMFFSIILAGKASSILLLSLLPLLPLLAIALKGERRPILWGLVVIMPLLAAFQGEVIEKWFFDKTWSSFHGSYRRVASFETPYQNIQVGAYEEQKSLFVDGTFAFSWPDSIQAESVIHPFLSAIASPSSILFLGTPPPDWVSEIAKYPGLRATFVELDERYSLFLQHCSSDTTRMHRIIDDPRAFLSHTDSVFDGVFIVPTDPTTLLTNRLFTVEAFQELKKVVASSGIVSISISGSENYLGPAMESALISMHKTIESVFPEVFAIPGDPIVFWAAKSHGVIASQPEILAERLRQRNVQTHSFIPESFSNILLPFRVEELQSWLARPVQVSLNRDARPAAFARQVRLWDIFSDSHLEKILNSLESMTFYPTCTLLMVLLFLFSILGRFFSRQRLTRTTLGITSSISGLSGMVITIVLIMVYQNRHGAMFQMAALFFGIFMLGLSLGSWAVRHVKKPETFCLKKLKLIQVLMAGWLSLAVFRPELQTAVAAGAAIFSVAFLQGFEFVLLNYRLKGARLSAQSAAGLLLLADNIGAVCGAGAAGLWLLPVMGIFETMMLTLILFCGNLMILFFLPPSEPLNPVSQCSYDE